MNPYMLPFLYRYENKEWIDHFFETGELQISSFHEYHRYEDNQLGDKSEGKTVNRAIDEVNKQTIITAGEAGGTCYTFCTSIVLDKGLFKTFSRDSVFRIRNTPKFLSEIAKSLDEAIKKQNNFVNGVTCGNCIYIKQKSVRKYLEPFNWDLLKDALDQRSLDFLIQALGPMHSNESLFLKFMKYQKQSEFRLIWSTNNPVKEKIVIKSPEAVKACERITDDDWE